MRKNREQHRTDQNIEGREFTCALLRHNMAADIPYLEVTGRKYVQNGGRSIPKNDHSFWPLSQISVRIIRFFFLFSTNLSYFYEFWGSSKK